MRGVAEHDAINPSNIRNEPHARPCGEPWASPLLPLGYRVSRHHDNELITKASRLLQEREVPGVEEIEDAEGEDACHITPVCAVLGRG